MIPSLNLSAPGFSPANAYQLARACQEVYTQAEIATADAHANVIDCGNAIVVVFRGTKSIRDIITDVSAWQRNIEGTNVHKGFYRSAISVLGKIEQAIDAIHNDRLIKENLPLFITGHSLGGAQAMIAALACKRAGFPIAGVYTFGQPRVGSRAYAGQYNSVLGPITFRVTNGADIVPWVPWCLGSYYHAGQEEYMPKPMVLEQRIIENPTTLRKLAFNGVELYRELKRGEQAELEDHHIENYLAKLGSVLPPANLNPILPLQPAIA